MKTMSTAEKVKRLEKEVAVLWQIVEDERLWHPSVIQEIRRRSKQARHDLKEKRLKTVGELFSKSR
jgi:uncharacterized protein (UPF0147 family)